MRSNMDQAKEQQVVDRICRDHGIQPEAITRAARHLGELRVMTADEIAASLAALEDEIVRHLQVAQAVSMTLLQV
jgi:hypothetical protein